jgi:hypothetical protein
VRTQSVNGEQAKRKENAPAQIRHIEHIANGGKKLFHIDLLSAA